MNEYIMDKIYLKIIKRHNKNEIAMSLTVSRRSHSGDPSSITGPVGVKYVVDRVALGQVFLLLLQFLLSIFVLQCSILIFIYTWFLPKTDGRCSFINRQGMNKNVHSYFYTNKIKQDATVSRYLFTEKSLYMFRVSIAPIIRSK